MKYLATILLTLIMSTALLAQDGPPPGGPMGNISPKERTKELKTKLNLTDDQVKKVETIYTDFQKKIESFMEKRDGDFREMKKTMDAAMDSTDSKILKVLDKDQQTKYKKIVEDRKKQMENMPPPPDEGTASTGLLKYYLTGRYIYFGVLA